MLCRDCKHCKTKPVGYVASRSWCEALPKKDRGIHPHLNTVNPKCPLKINRELIKGKHEKDWHLLVFFCLFLFKTHLYPVFHNI